MAPESRHLQKIYGEEYYFSGKAWNDGYEDYNAYASKSKHPWSFMVPKILELKKVGKYSILDVH